MGILRLIWSLNRVAVGGRLLRDWFPDKVAECLRTYWDERAAEMMERKQFLAILTVG